MGTAVWPVDVAIAEEAALTTSKLWQTEMRNHT